MIYTKGDRKKVTGIYVSDGESPQTMRAIQAVYKGDRLVWTLTRSCYGRGYWIQEKPWVDNDLWKNNR